MARAVNPSSRMRRCLAAVPLLAALSGGCHLSSEPGGEPGGAGGKADDGDQQEEPPAPATSADSVVLSAEEPLVTLTLALDPGVRGPVTIRLAPRGARYASGVEWEDDFLERFGRGEVSAEECVEGLAVAGQGLAPTSVDVCLVPVVGLDRAEKVARPETVTADAVDGQVTVELYAAPAATRAGHAELWLYAEAIW
jgi:hypothetical protein